MSGEAAVAFAERVKSDEAFQSRLAGAAGPAARLAIAREEGFDLGHDDVAAVKRSLGVEELSDEDLDHIAGGVGTSTTVITSLGSAMTAVAAAGFF